MEGLVTYENDDLNLKATELRLGLPGIDEADDDHEQAVSTARISKRSSPDTADDCVTESKSDEAAPVSKAQIVGWPPIRSYRKNTLQPKKTEVEAPGIYVKVSMDGAPYLRKIDLKVYKGYPELLKALENMFNFTIGEYSEREGFKGSEYAPTYEDKDGDWMLVGDVPWDMFMSSCKRLRIMKGSEARGLGCPRMSDSLESHINGGELLNQNWFSGDHQVCGWTGSGGSSFQSQSIVNGNNSDQSLYSVLTNRGQLHSVNPYESIGSTEFISSRNYGLMARGAPGISNTLPHAVHPLDYLGGRDAPTSMMLDDMGWMNLPHQNPTLHDQMGKPYLRSWNQ